MFRNTYLRARIVRSGKMNPYDGSPQIAFRIPASPADSSTHGGAEAESSVVQTTFRKLAIAGLVKGDCYILPVKRRSAQASYVSL